MIKPNNIFAIKFTPFLLTLVIFLLAFGNEVSLSGKGLDLNDGGWSLLRASFPESEVASGGRDCHYMHSMFVMFNGSVAALRIASIILILTALIIFTSGIMRVCFENELKNRLYGFQLFLLLSISTIPCFWIERQPTYNILGTFSFFAVIGTALFAVQFRRKKDYNHYFLLLILAGIFIAFGFLTRFPIVGPSCVILALIYYFSFKTNKLFLSSVLLVAGIILGLLIHIYFYESTQTLINIYQNGWELSKIVYEESISEKLTRQTLDILAAWQVAIGRHKFAILILFFGVNFFPKGKFWILIPAIIWTLFSSYNHGDLNGGFSLFFNYYRFWASLGFILFPILFLQLDFKQYQTLKISNLTYQLIKSSFLLVLYLLLPPFCAIGAGSSLMYTGNFFGCLHPLVLIIVLKKNGHFLFNWEKYIYWVLFLFCIGPTINYYNSRFNSPLFSVDGSRVEDCREKTEVGFYANTIEMSERQSLLLNGLNKILKENGFVRGTKILNFTDLPGLLYAVGGDFNIHAWTNVHHGSAVPYFMKNAKVEDIKSSWILYDAINWNDRIEVSFNSRDLDLPKTHQEIGMIDKFKIYKPKALVN